MIIAEVDCSKKKEINKMCKCGGKSDPDQSKEMAKAGVTNGTTNGPVPVKKDRPSGKSADDLFGEKKEKTAEAPPPIKKGNRKSGKTAGKTAASLFGPKPTVAQVVIEATTSQIEEADEKEAYIPSPNLPGDEYFERVTYEDGLGLRVSGVEIVGRRSWGADH